MKYDKALNVSRVFFILSCVMAHCGLTHSELSGSVENGILTVWSFLACIGVPCFLITSGILFKKKNVSEFIRSKVFTIIIPWLFCGFLVYIVTQYPAYSFIGCANFIGGIGSYLYYIPVLLACYLIFYIIPQTNVSYIACIIITALSLLLTQFGIISLSNNYLNIFNWVGYFAIGQLIRKHDLLNKIIERTRWHLIGCAVVCLVCCLIAGAASIETYFYLFILIAVPFYFVLFYLISNAWLENSALLNKLGQATFTIYLVHMPVAAVFKRIVRLIYPQAYLILPFVTVAFVFGIINIYLRIISKQKRLDRISRILLGMR